MCGIAGFSSPKLSRDERHALAQRMAKALHHRGPDGHGIWSEDDRLSLIHTRLAIIDLSETGHQPMVSPSGRFVMVFNGEVYNYVEIRRELESVGSRFRGHSDTETLLHAVEHFGVEGAVQRARGMFAIALLDTDMRQLHLLRDRLGEKPLYYGLLDQNFVFASELKPIMAHPGFKFDIDPSSLSYFVKYNYVPAPRSIFKGIKKLPAAHRVTFDLRTGQVGDPIAYWSLEKAVRRKPIVFTSDREAIEVLESKLNETVGMQLRSDVPVGCFLSGGIDSSLISAVAQARSETTQLKTFTIGFHEADYDESKYARQVANHLGTEHHEWVVSPQDVRSIICDIPRIYDEPFADSSQLPSVMVARLTRNEVKVCLSGDGGDELFGGYTRYLWAERIWGKISVLPGAARRLVGNTLANVHPQTLSRAATALALPVTNMAQKVEKLARALEAPGPVQLYDILLSTWYHPEEILSHPQAADLLAGDLHGFSLRERMMMEDARHYLCDDIMVKVDRATMSVGLESRAPFLDHELFELAWCLPDHLKIQKGAGKIALRQILSRHIPTQWIERPKAGFAVPLEHWFRGELKDWVTDVLSPDHLARSGLFKPQRVEKILSEHMSGERNWQYNLWNLLVFQSWYDHWKENRPV